jgi:beta-lactamase regulating signal transducer with metallopeptidase domain
VIATAVFDFAGVTQAAGLALTHFAWQGCLLCGILAAVLFQLRAARASTRYVVCCAGLLAMAATPVATFFAIAGAPSSWWVACYAGVSGETGSVAEVAPEWMAAAAPYLVGAWLAGVCVFALRLLGGWLNLRFILRDSVFSSRDRWQETVARLSQRLGMRVAVRIAHSAATSVPTLIGWIRPVVLMPVTSMTGLSPRQLELILAHELAHIRRHDYLVNLLQSLVEVLLFYHPGVWWTSGRIREEREYCCDDLAVAACGDPLAYARTLSDLETLRAGALRLAPSAIGGSLMSRVSRLLGAPAPRGRRGTVWVLPLFALTGLAGAATVVLDEVPAADAPVAASTEAVQSEREVAHGTWLGVVDSAAERPSDVNEVPLLSEIPILGHLFSVSNQANEAAAAEESLAPSFFDLTPEMIDEWLKPSENDRGEDVRAAFRVEALRLLGERPVEVQWLPLLSRRLPVADHAVTMARARLTQPEVQDRLLLTHFVAAQTLVQREAAAEPLAVETELELALTQESEAHSETGGAETPGESEPGPSTVLRFMYRLEPTLIRSGPAAQDCDTRLTTELAGLYTLRVAAALDPSVEAPLEAPVQAATRLEWFACPKSELRPLLQAPAPVAAPFWVNMRARLARAHASMAQREFLLRWLHRGERSAAGGENSAEPVEEPAADESLP